MPKRIYSTVESAILILFLTGIHCLPIQTSSVSTSITSPWWTHFVCQFFHANIFHLIANLWTLWILRPSLHKFAIAYLLSIPATFATIQPAVGASSIIYIFLAFQLANMPWKRLILFFALNLTTAFIPPIAFLVHMAAFGIGIIYIIITQKANEYRRVMQGR